LKLKKHIFRNRKDAFEKLCNVLPINEIMQEKWIVLATSAGGVPIGLQLAEKLNAKFDFLFTKKLFTSKK
jgi:putative phosphoribosyl transferase